VSSGSKGTRQGPKPRTRGGGAHVQKMIPEGLRERVGEGLGISHTIGELCGERGQVLVPRWWPHRIRQRPVTEPHGGTQGKAPSQLGSSLARGIGASEEGHCKARRGDAYTVTISNRHSTNRQQSLSMTAKKVGFVASCAHVGHLTA
jgi:hypothetical protein